MTILDKITQTAKNDYIILIPIILIFSVLNTYLYYKFFYEFDITPYLNLNDSIMYCFISLGESSFIFAIILTLEIGLILYYRNKHLLMKDIYNYFVRSVDETELIKKLNGEAIKKLKILKEIEKLANNLDELKSKSETNSLKENKEIEDIINQISQQKKSLEIVEEEICKLKNLQSENLNMRSKYLTIKKYDNSYLNFGVPCSLVVLAISIPIIPLMVMLIYWYRIETNDNLVFSILEFRSWELGLIILMLFVSIYRINNDKIVNFSLTNLIYLVFILNIFSYQTVHTIKEGLNVKKYNKYIGTEIITNKGKFVSGDSIIYIGRTRENVFFHSLDKRQTIVIPAAEIISQKYVSH